MEAALDPDPSPELRALDALTPGALRDPVVALVPSLIFKKGLDLKHEVAGELAESYHSALVAAIKANDYRYASGRLTVHLAREFGFCYGVDRAVDYAYQARLKLPRPARLPHRRDHPQPARQRPAARARASAS